METTTASVFLLFVFSITQSSFLFGVANATNDPVLDTDGEQLRTGVQYYIVSAISGPSGAVLDIGWSSKPCPESGVPIRFGGYGTPVMFSNANTGDGIVRLSSDVNIEFIPLREKICQTSTVWTLTDYDDLTGKWCVSIDGTKGNRGPDTRMNWFKIEKVGNNYAYKLKYCPSVGDSCPTLCNEISRYLDAYGHIRLALTTGQGWPFMFFKAEEATEGIQQAVRA